MEVKMKKVRKECAMKCEVCGKGKLNVTSIPTYDRRLVSACPECAEEMKETIQLIKITNNWMLSKTMPTVKRTLGSLVLTPLESIS